MDLEAAAVRRLGVASGRQHGHRRCPGRRTLRLAALAAALAAGGLPALAQSTDKIKNGDWATASNWRSNILPSATIAANVLSDTSLASGAVARAMVLNAELTIGGAEGALNVPSTVLIGSLLSSSGTLVVDTEAALALQVGSFGMQIGQVDRGQVLIRRGEVQVAGQLRVGGSAGSNPVGVQQTAYGLLSVQGAQAVMQAGRLGVGNTAGFGQRVGDGEVLVSEGGLLRSGGGTIARGTLTVQDSGSTWTSFLNLQDAQSNDILVEGALVVQNGGTVNSSYALSNLKVYGNAGRGTQGQLTVDGSGSSLSVPRLLDLQGINGVGGKMTVSRGGYVHSGAGVVGNKGEVLVTGLGSWWQVDGRLDLESYIDDSRMRIDNGAQVLAGDFSVGNNNGTARLATLTVSGAGSGLVVANLAEVGRRGNSGRLELLDGALATSRHAAVAQDSRGSGVVNIDGAGSAWRVAEIITIGALGQGRVQLSNGGSLAARSAQVGSSDEDAVRNLAAGRLVLGGNDGAVAAGRLTLDEGLRLAQTGTLEFNHTGAPYRFETPTVSLNAGDGRLEQRAGITALDADFSAFTGPTAVLGGTLLVNQVLGSALVTVAGGATLGGSGTLLGSVLAEPGALVQPGNSPGRLTVDGSFSLGAGARLVMQIAGTAPGSQHDVLAVGGNLLLAGGSLDLVFIDGFAPAAGQQFSLLSAGGSFSAPAQVQVLGLLPGWAYSSGFDASSGRFTLLSLSDGISAAPVPLPPSSAMLAAGLAALAWWQRRRRPGAALRPTRNR